MLDPQIIFDRFLRVHEADPGRQTQDVQTAKLYGPKPRVLGWRSLRDRRVGRPCLICRVPGDKHCGIPALLARGSRASYGGRSGWHLVPLPIGCWQRQIGQETKRIRPHRFGSIGLEGRNPGRSVISQVRIKAAYTL
jgi:hypothetical protein